MNAEMSLVMKKTEEREALRGVIQQWNANRLDLFELSEPNDDLLFHGVMRFYFQDSGQKVATKCIRVASDATSQAVIETLIEKFRPDMRMLSVPEYALYEIHENGDERRLGTDEKPLLVQLNWHKDDREGRFLLRRIDDVTNVPAGTFQEQGSSFRRKLSKREKKQLKKQEKINRVKSIASTDENCGGVAEKLYTELPETSFTRSISNPESVMRRRRQQKLEQKLQQFRSKDGGPDTGGTLKIYGESLCRDVPYKTLLLSVRDNATQVVKEMLAKYGLTREDAHQYCLVQVNTAIPETPPTTQQNGGDQFMNNQREYILDEDECPLAILMNHPQSRGSIMFHVRRRPADYHPRKRKKKIQQKWNQGSSNELMEYRYEEGFDRLPFFLELNPDGSEITSGSPKRHRLHPNVTEVGSDRASPYGQSQSLQLFGPNIQPRHCVIAHTEGIVTVTPCSREAETFVNGQRIFETTILQHGATVKFGRIHNFKFIDPCFEERNRQRHDYSYDSRQCSTSVHEGSETPAPHNYETTFDVHGNVETRSTSSQGNRDDTRSQRSIESSRDSHNRSSTYERYSRGTDPILPAVLEIREETEEAFLHALITDLEPSAPSFKLAPAYTLYLAARYRASTHYRPELIPTERAHRLTLVLVRVAAMIHNVIQDRYCDVQSLALWLANASELLNFLKSDRHICAFSLEAQDSLADTVQITFRHLLVCLQRELAAVMPSFLSDHDDQNGEADDVSTSSVLGVLMSAMALLRGCRLNAALTIQLFSKLFHFLNVWAFNRLVAPNSIYCSKAWGLRIKNRLAHIQIWAERQGLELAADCHLAKLMQAAHLLQAPKYTGDELAELTSTCFKLNSLQLRALLHKYQPTPDEPRLPHDVIENVVRVAENLADELARSDGREVCLEEESELLLPFLLPDDGYSCEVVRGVPQGLIEFISPLQVAGLCRLSAQPTSNGYWTVYMGPHNSQGPVIRSPSAMSNRSSGYVANREEPDIQVIKLHKSNSGMGLSIVAAKGAGQDRLGIYIKSVVKGGAADANGRLQAGDQLLKVDGQSLVGITQEKAAEYLVRTGPIVTLEIAKQGAIYHGLATLLSQPSPVMTRASSHSNLRPQSGLSSSLSSLGPGRQSNHTCHARSHLPSGNQVNSKVKLPFQSRYGNTLHPIHAFLTVPPIQPTVGDTANNNCLTVPSQFKNMNKFKCYKTPKDNELCLCEDIFQQHQAKLIDCDSEDAKAVSSYTLQKEEEEQKKMESNTNNNDNDTASSTISECCCNLSDNTSTQSSDNTEQEPKQENPVQETVPVETDNKQKLTLEEREKALKELDEIINSIKITRNIREFGSLDLSTTDRKEDFKKSRFLSSMLELNFSEMKIDDNDNEMEGKPDCDRELNNNISDDNNSPNHNETNDSGPQFTVGKVARLAKFFSQMGEAGIIRTKGNRAMNREFKSEPNISFNEEEKSEETNKVTLTHSMDNLCNNVPCCSDTNDNGAMENYKTDLCDASEPIGIVNTERQYRSQSLNIDRIEIDDSSSSSSSSTNRIIFARSKTLHVDELDKISRSDSTDSRKLQSDISLDYDTIPPATNQNNKQPTRELSSSSDTSGQDKASYSEKQDRFKRIKDSFFNNTISDEAGSSRQKFKHIHNFLLKEELLKQRMKSGSIDMYHMGGTFDDERGSEQRRKKLISQRTMDCQSNFSFTKDASMDTEATTTSIPQREKLKRWYSDQILEEETEDFGVKDTFRRVLRNNLNKTKFRAKRMRNVIVTPIKIHQRIILRQDQDGIEEEESGLDPCRKLSPENEREGSSIPSFDGTAEFSAQPQPSPSDPELKISSFSSQC
uniref:Afadin n=1 Tax=Cacopsylla melanoneura TaxID=428564 RepID=A0A8D8LU77_9HEMI